MSQDNIATMRGAYDAFARAILAQLPFDRQIERDRADVQGFGPRHDHGIQAVINEVFEPTLERFDDFRVSATVSDAGERVVVIGRFLGRGKDTGNELNAPFAHVWTLRNGKVTQFQNYTDTANWLRAMYQVHIEQPVGAV